MVEIQNTASQPIVKGITVTLDQLIATQHYQLHDLQMLSNQLSKSMHRGHHQLSIFKGRGMEFAESRLYQAGDDMRHIDWRVSARTGQLHTKLFQEERERPVNILLDLRSHMFFGTKTCFKSYFASHLAAYFAWFAYDTQSHLSAQVLTSNKSLLHKPSKTKKQLLRLFSQLIEANHHFDTSYPANVIHLSDGLANTRKTASIDSVIYIISDFSDMNEKAYKELSRLAVNNMVACIQVTDDLDEQLPRINAKITDGKSFLNLNRLGLNQLKHYHSDFLTEQQTLIKYCQNHGIHYLSVNTADYKTYFKGAWRE